MASRTGTIKTTLQLDGEREYKEALKQTRQELKVMGSELKATAAEYQLTGDKSEYLRKKTDILTREIREQEKVIAQTAEMYEKASAGGDELASRANKLKIEFNEGQAALYRMRRELQTADRELEELGRDSIDAGRQLERGVADGAQEASEDLRKMAREASDSLKEISSLEKLKVGAGMVSTAINFVGDVVEWTNAQAEYNLAVAKLATNAEARGADWEIVEDELIRVTAMTGDANTAVIGLSALLTAGYTDAAVLQEMATLLMGATVDFQDMSFEGLSTSLQETLAKKEATGEFAELLEKMQVDVTGFNDALNSGMTNEAMLQYILALLDSEGDFATLYENYVKNAGKTLEFATAQAELNYNLSQLGEHIAGWANPAVVWLNKLAEAGTKAAENPTWGNIGALVDEITAPMMGNVQTGSLLDVAASRYGYGKSTAKGNNANTLYELRQYIQPEDIGIEDALKDAREQLHDFGADAEVEGEYIGEKLGDGIVAQVDIAMQEVYDKIDAASRMVNSISTEGASTTGGGGGGSVPVEIHLDGKKVGSGLLPYTDALTGRNMQTQVYYG